VPGYQFPFEFRLYLAPELNSFALPGGIIYVSSGMVQLARSEPELAGVLAHQIAHVALRHGTQRASRDFTGGRFVGSATVQEAMSRLEIGFGPDSPVLRYTMAQEREADTIAAQILFDARFDPREMTRFFDAVSAQSRQLQSEFVASHPIPNDMADVVQRELQALGQLPAGLRPDSRALRTTQNDLLSEAANRRPAQGEIRDSFGGFVDSAPPDTRRPVAPSTRMVTYQGPDISFRHPANWRVTTSEGYDVTVSPEGGVMGNQLAWGMRIGSYRIRGDGYSGQNSFTVPGVNSRDTTLESATDRLLSELRRSNPNLREVGVRERRTVDGEPAFIFELSNESPIGGREVAWMVTVLRPNGLLYYMIGVAPEADAEQYSSVFGQIAASFEFF
jgi:hypothetical protein